MTDVTSNANGNAPSAASAPGVDSVLDNTAGQGDAERFATSAVPGFGGATVWPTWPGVARPAGWFLPASGEAAPPGGPQAEPARPDIPDHQYDSAPDYQYDSAGAYEDSAPDDDDAAYTYPAPDDDGTAYEYPVRYDDDTAYGDPRPYGDPAPYGDGAPPAVGPTAALRGRAGGPGFDLAPGTSHEPPRAGYQSGWQRAQGVWQGSGVAWERPPASAGNWDRRNGGRGNWDQAQSWGPQPDWDPRQDWDAEEDWGSAQDRDSGQAEPLPVTAFASAPTLADIPPAYASAPGYSPEYSPEASFQSPATRPDAVIPGIRVRAGAADEMFRAWDSPVRAASGVPWREPSEHELRRRGQPGRGQPGRERSGRERSGREVVRRRVPRDTARRRRLAWQAARVGVPVAVIVTVGVGAVMMLTGKPGEMLADQSAGKTSTSGNQSAAGSSSAAEAARRGALPGYPGQQGSVTVDSAGTAGAAQVAVGGADGHPAIWHRAANGTWSLVSASLLAAFQAPDTGSLSSIAHGRAGWIAVGDDTSGGGNAPVVVTSADGVTWHIVTGTNVFSGPGIRVNAVAAGPDGYVVVGQQTQGSRQFAAMWWSPDLRTWVRGDNGGFDGRLSVSDAYGVTATASGFVTVGSHSGRSFIWTSGAGLAWTGQNSGQPAGSPAATLKVAAAKGSQVVAAGNATLARGGDIPFAMVSSDDGRTWKQVLLPVPEGLGTVSSLTADGNGFAAEGKAGRAGEQRSVTWTSPDGQAWSTPAPVTSGA
ncbi:MAG: hypothetical protein ACRDN0_31845 [Trebonia sp.]